MNVRKRKKKGCKPLACGGEKGVGHALRLLTEELRTAMMLAGCPDVKAARNRELVQLRGESPPRPGGQTVIASKL
jgi:isopentenyl diphosphate isomerase/L-lactate dehydrogenase-like FMN-dependent dehydrogenase